MRRIIMGIVVMGMALMLPKPWMGAIQFMAGTALMVAGVYKVLDRKPGA